MSTTGRKPSACVIAGLGRSGFSCARYLREHGWRLAVTDTRADPPQLEQLRRLDPGIPVRTGRLDTALLDEAVCVIASPGLPLDHPFFVEARRRGIEIFGDIELFARAADAPAAGITGTNGKSTVTTLVGRMAARAGIDVRVGGNLGQPALDLLARAESPGLYVLELSSFQLETTQSLDLKAAAVLNVSQDHLDRYPTLEAYALAKARIFERCDTAVVNLDDPLVARMPGVGQRVLGFSLRGAAGADYTVEDRAGPWLMRRAEPLLPLSALRIRGLHNAANALAALALGEALDVPLAAMCAELKEFPGLAHRTEWIAEIAAVTYVDDSKGTNVGATLAAVNGMQGPLVLIAGGEGKNQDFRPLAQAFRGKVRHIVLIGRDAPRLAEALQGICPIERCDTLQDAVTAAARAASPGDTVLLSPACASLDMFRDYAHRGEVFARAVRELGP